MHIIKTSIPYKLWPSAKPNPKSYTLIVSTNAALTISEKAWIEVWHNNWNQNNSCPSPPKTELEKKTVIFWKTSKFYQKSKAGLMLILNETLKRLNLKAHVRFSKVGYFQSGAIFRLFTEKSNAEDLLRDYATTLIWAAKFVDKQVIEVETLKHWHKLNAFNAIFW